MLRLPVRVRLNEKVELLVDLNGEDVEAALEQALSNNRLLKITTLDGEVLSVNPLHVLYLQELAPDEGAASPNGSRPASRSAPVRRRSRAA